MWGLTSLCWVESFLKSDSSDVSQDFKRGRAALYRAVFACTVAVLVFPTNSTSHEHPKDKCLCSLKGPEGKGGLSFNQFRIWRPQIAWIFYQNIPYSWRDVDCCRCCSKASTKRLLATTWARKLCIQLHLLSSSECQTWADDALLFRHFRHEDKPFNKNALHALVGGLDFKGQALPRQVRQVGIGIGQVDLPHTECCQSLDGSLRHFLSFFRLPGEAPLYSLNMLTKSNSVKFLKLFFYVFHSSCWT